MTQLPPTDHYLRLVKPSAVFDEASKKVDSAAFRIREEDAGSGLSGNWLEYFKKPRVAALAEIWSVQNNKLVIRPSHRLAELNVGATCAHVLVGHHRTITFEHKPESRANGDDHDDPSHSGILGYSPEEDIINELISQTVTALVAPPSPAETKRPAKRPK